MSRVAFVTGGTRGIGFAVAEALLAAGDRVAITGTSNDGVEQASLALATRSGDVNRVLGVVRDVREAPAVESAMHDVVARFGGLDILVNNAGVGVGAPIADLSHDEWHRIIDTNVTGVFHCCKAAIPHLRARGGGWIVSVSSLASKNPFAGGAAYCASKAALNHFSEALMQEVRHDNIRVSCVMPGSVATGFGGHQVSDAESWKLAPEDVARVVVDLISHDARSLPSRVELRPSRPPRKG